MRSNCLAWLSRCSYYKKEVVGAVLLLGLASAQAQNFLGNKKFKDTDVNANSQTDLTFDLFNSMEGTLTATVKDTLPVTAPAGQLWFSPAGGATVVPGSAIGTCAQGVITYGDFLDAPTNSKAQTLTITNAVVPPRPSGTTDPNCSIRVPVFTGAVNSDSNVTNFVPGANATAVDASSAVHTSNDFSATVRVRAPVDPLETNKSFSPSLVVGGAKTQLTINVRNNTSNPSVALNGVNLTDNLPSGMTATGTPTFSPDCGAPTTTLADPAIVNMTGATIGAEKTCQITVDVMAPNITGALTNTIAAGQVTATGGYANQVAAEAVLNVRSEIKITKAFGNSGGTSQWHTVDAPAPANLHGVEFKTTPATAEVGQPVPVRVYFSNPSSTPLTGGRLVEVCLAIQSLSLAVSPELVRICPQRHLLLD